MMSDSMIHHEVSLQVLSLYPELGEGLCKAGGEIEDVVTEFRSLTSPLTVFGKRGTQKS